MNKTYLGDLWPEKSQTIKLTGKIGARNVAQPRNESSYHSSINIKRNFSNESTPTTRVPDTPNRWHYVSEQRYNSNTHIPQNWNAHTYNIHRQFIGNSRYTYDRSTYIFWRANTETFPTITFDCVKRQSIENNNIFKKIKTKNKKRLLLSFTFFWCSNCDWKYLIQLTAEYQVFDEKTVKLAYHIRKYGWVKATIQIIV